MVAYLKSGPELLVNTITTNDQSFSVITALPNGGYVITWRDTSFSADDASGAAVRGQIYSATGVKVGTEFRVNSTTFNSQVDPSITALANGGFVVTWDDFSQTGLDTTGVAVRGQIFGATGTKVGAEFLVNATTPFNQGRSSVSALTSGGFIAVWNDFSGVGDADGGIRGQRFSATGAKIGPEILINIGATTNVQEDPSVAGLANGGFVAAWTNVISGSNDTITVRRFDQNGTQEGVDVTLNNGIGVGELGNPSVLGLANGSYVVAYSDGVAGNPRAEIFNSFGTSLGTITLNTLTTGSQQLPTLAALANGGFVAAWQDSSGANPGDTAGSAVRAAVFDGFGNRVSTLALSSTYDSELLANTTTTSQQQIPSIAVLANGDFVVTWSDLSSTGGDGSGYAVRAQRFRPYQEQLGSNSDNLMVGTIGHDFILAFLGADVLKGNAGDDILDGGTGGDSLDGGIGNDTASYGSASLGVIADLTTPATNTNDASGDIYISIENLNGSSLGDTLRGNASANQLDGGEGDDTLAGRGGADILIGAQGNDTATYAFATAAVVADLATTVGETGEAMGDTFVAVENLTGSNLNDTLKGDGAANILIGGAGNDILEGRGGADVLDGGLGVNTASYASSTTILVADLLTPAFNSGAAAGDTYTSIQNLLGGSGNEVLRGDTGANVLTGGLGNDLLEGRGGADKLDGGLGIDSATYFFSTLGVRADLTNPSTNTNDALGDIYVSIENLVGSPQADILKGNAMANVLTGGASGDVLDGAGGIDTASYFEGPGVTADLGNSANNLGQALGDTYTSIENLEGSISQPDILRGDALANVLSGFGGIDTLEGGGGNDTLIGGAGADILNGGAGKDTFVNNFASEGGDTIQDFLPIDDTLRFDASNFGGGLTAGALAATKFVANTAPVANQAFGQFLYDTDGGQLSWDADGTGIGGPVLIATLTTLPTLTTADFQILA